MDMLREISDYRYTVGGVAMEVKRRAPKAHTVLELVRHRWGNAANFVIIFSSIKVLLSMFPLHMAS